MLYLPNHEKSLPPAKTFYDPVLNPFINILQKGWPWSNIWDRNIVRGILYTSNVLNDERRSKIPDTNYTRSQDSAQPLVPPDGGQLTTWYRKLCGCQRGAAMHMNTWGKEGKPAGIVGTQSYIWSSEYRGNGNSLAKHRRVSWSIHKKTVVQPTTSRNTGFHLSVWEQSTMAVGRFLWRFDRCKRKENHCMFIKTDYYELLCLRQHFR